MLVPTFSWDFLVAPLPHQQPARNGWDYASPPSPTPGQEWIYTPDATDLDLRDMGAVSASVLAAPGRARGNHPLDSFSAIGPLAGELIAGQRPFDVFAPLRALVACGGAVVLMGVGLTKMTLLHLAEQRAGRNLFRRWANGPDGRPMEVETGGCSEGFEQLAPYLAPLEQRIKVGKSLWRVYPARDTLQAATQAIRNNPDVTLCGKSPCWCEDARLGGPILSTAGP